MIPYRAMSTFGVRRTRFGVAVAFTGLVLAGALGSVFLGSRPAAAPTTAIGWAFLVVPVAVLLLTILLAPEERLRFQTADGTWDFFAQDLRPAAGVRALQDRVTAGHPGVREGPVDGNRLPLISTTLARGLQPELRPGAPQEDLSEVAVRLPDGPWEGISLRLLGAVSAIPAIGASLYVSQFVSGHGNEGGFVMLALTVVFGVLFFFLGAEGWRRLRRLTRLAKAKLGF